MNILFIYFIRIYITYKCIIFTRIFLFCFCRSFIFGTLNLRLFIRFFFIHFYCDRLLCSLLLLISFISIFSLWIEIVGFLDVFFIRFVFLYFEWTSIEKNDGYVHKQGKHTCCIVNVMLSFSIYSFRSDSFPVIWMQYQKQRNIKTNFKKYTTKKKNI